MWPLERRTSPLAHSGHDCDDVHDHDDHRSARPGVAQALRAVGPSARVVGHDAPPRSGALVRARGLRELLGDHTPLGHHRDLEPARRVLQRARHRRAQRPTGRGAGARRQPAAHDAHHHRDGPARPSHLSQDRQRVLHPRGHRRTRPDRHVERADVWSTRSASEGECDFIDRIAQRHPLRVLATILGIDRDDEERCSS